jgi:fibronectin-binding autotransporter adhesin
LWLTVSSVALATALLSPGAARAANYNANDETSLKAAITSANADPAATITLTADITVTDPSALPALTQAVTLNTGTFILTDGTFSGPGAFKIAGSGQLSFTGDSVFGGTFNLIDNSIVRIDGGATVTAGVGISTLSQNADLTVSGAGSVLTVDRFDMSDTNNSTASVRIENGGVLHSTYTGGTSNALGKATGSHADLVVTGAGSRLDVDGSMTVANTASASGNLTISDGATATFGGLLQLGPLAATPTTPSTVTVRDAGSSLTVGSRLDIFRGTMEVLNGAQVFTPQLRLGAGSGAAPGALLISGAGSSVTSTGTVTVGFNTAAPGILTLADDGVLNATTFFTVANAAGRTGVVNIGGGEGQAATQAGVLNTVNVAFGAGTGRLNFNHTETDYDFDPTITGLGAINQVAGVTHLTGNSSGFTGTTTVSGGELHVDGALGGATSGVTVSGGAFQVNGTASAATLNVSNGAVGLESGGKLTAATANIGENSAIGVDGAGSLLTITDLNMGIAAGTVTVLIQNGGAVHTTAPASSLSWGNVSGAVVDFTLTGAGSRFDSNSQIGVASAAGAGASVRVLDGAVMTATRINLGSPTQIQATPPSMRVDGAGSSVADSGVFAIYKGSLDVTGGGAVTTASFQIGSANGTANLRVSGLGSSVTSTTSMVLGGGNNNTSTMTLADGGVVHAGSITLGGTAATRVGVLNIGAGAAAPAAAAGVLDTSSVTFGIGGGSINFNHTDADYTFATPISGLGAINQVAGVTHLTGASAGFTGTTTVSGGELRVDGTLGDATSSVVVNNGGVLGGSAAIGGDVAVTDGVLAPGNSPGTLTIAGNLTLAPASLLDVEFGLSNVVGGPMNDLVKVGGDLTLDGTIDVTVSPGGVFDAGLYRVINYGGVLTDNGLTIGATPPGSAVTVQTALPGQVNLINTAGFTVNFWDGDGAGSSGNNLLDGGAGTWTAVDTNWTIQTGAVNTHYDPGSFVVFTGAPGAVSIDNTTGVVRAGGLQFAVDGYSLNGQALTLVGASSTIRVGDGTADGANYVATIGAGIAGAAELVKTDLGTLVLTGVNTYGGGTRVSAGRLLINGNQLGAVGDYSVEANGTLGGTGALGGNVNVAGVLAPGGLATAGTLIVNGDVTLASTARLDYRLGAAGVAGGGLNDLLRVNGDLTLDGTLNVAQTAGGTFGPGIYRLIDYTGALIDNGLNLGSLPGGFTNTVQTSIAGQVNLLANVPPPAVFDFWDGDTGVAADGVITGGDGTWRVTPTNWTKADGSANGAYADGLFAIFAGRAGTVTVDGSAGAIGVGGLQFAADGYSVVGDPVALEAGQTIIRVGDGTTAGAGFTATIASALTGPGQLDKTDLGTLILTGANTYGGGTRVSGGKLLVNGDQSGAAGDYVIEANGILGGTGVLGGDLDVAGVLTPGGLATAGTLTVNGDVTLASTARLDYRLGAAGVVGGGLNDLLHVNGDLTLDGVLNVAQSVGGTFGPGLYRLIDYTGALTDNGLNLGSLPGGFTNTVQTSIAGQVNLLADVPPPGGGTPSVFDFWDGDTGVAADGVITGGDGIWRATPANWTTADGSANGAYADGLFAVFAGTAGTATVDGSAGAIGVSGLQFAADGYSLVGDAVTLEAGQIIIRVGDGTTAGAAFTATIASALTGPGQLDKTDAGTLVLTGANTFAGGAHVSGGTLRLGDGGTTGSILGDVVNDGVLAFDRSDSVTFAGAISGGGTIVQIGGGTLALTADSSAFTGRTEVRAGTLAVDGVLGGGITVLSGARLVGTGQVGGLTNLQGATVSPGHDGVGVLTVAGAYAGAGGTLEMDVRLGATASTADRLVVRGATSGSTLVTVNRLAGDGRAPPADGILLVQVDGASDGVFTLADGDYRLGGEIVLVDGAYGYVLRKDAADGDWRLRSNLAGDGASGPLYQPGAPVYEAYPQALQLLNGLGTLRQRIGGRQWLGREGSGVWGRLAGGHTRLHPASRLARPT